MARWLPFTVHFKIHPKRPEKRFERVRDLQMIGNHIYDALVVLTQLNLARPGGGQVRNDGQWSNLSYGAAVKPQFGETPPQAMITGFYDAGSSTASAPQPQTQLLHTNAWVTGPYNQTPFISPPSSTILTQVKTLKELLETTVNDALPANVDPVSVFRLDFADTVFGDRGQHWPR